MNTTEAPKAVSLSAWKKNAIHYVTCPSGSVVGIKVPDLPAMIEAGNIPQHLLETAIGVARQENPEPSIELIKKEREFSDVLVKITVADPKLSDEDVSSVPYEDKEFIVQIATRQRDLDAEGEHIGGLTKSEKFRRFRSLGEFDPALEGV